MTTTTSAATVRFSRAAGRYTFPVYPLGADFEKLPAVYVITRRDLQGNHKVLYVGQTENLHDRFADHHKWWCMSQNGASHVCATVVTDEAQRLAMENDLTTAYRPPCNG